MDLKQDNISKARIGRIRYIDSCQPAKSTPSHAV